MAIKNQLRIIGGQWKRRQLDFASIDGLRPTPDRVKETLFNWLMWDIQNAKVLDLCTGSGSLSFEALSRGAQECVMIEPNTQQIRFLQQNIQKLNAQPNTLLIADTAQQALKKLLAQSKYTAYFDVVFLDPPYSLNLWQELAILTDSTIKAQGLIYVEANIPLTNLQLPASWQLIKQTKAGQVFAGLWQKTQ